MAQNTLPAPTPYHPLLDYINRAIARADELLANSPTPEPDQAETDEA